MNSIAVDIGIYNTRVATLLPGGEIILLKPYHGETVQGMVFPSFLKFYANGELEKYGEPAKDFLSITPDLVVWGIKRLLGKSYDGAKKEIERFRYPIEKANDGSIVIPIGNRKYTISELTRLFLEKIRADCEADFNPIRSNVTKAIITYPAYFDAKQIQALREASEGAGFEKVELVTEPEAAAVAYKDILDFTSEKWVMVIDWGTETLDIVIVGFSLDDKGIPKITWKFPAYGDTRFGGIDMDDALCKKVKETYGLKDVDPKTDAYLRTQIEMAKIILSAEPWTIRLFEIESRPYTFSFVGSAKDLPAGEDINKWIVIEDAISPILEKFKTNLLYALEKDSLSPGMVNGLILIGESMNIPCVRKVIRDVFEDNENVVRQLELLEQQGFSISPSEAVVKGAIIRSAGEFITGTPILPYTYGFLLDDQLLPDTIVAEGTAIQEKIEKQVELLRRFKNTNELISVSLYKKARTIDGDKHYKVGDYEFLPVVEKNRPSSIIARIEIDKNLVLTLSVTDKIAQRTLKCHFTNQEQIIPEPSVLRDWVKRPEVTKDEYKMDRTLIKAGLYFDGLGITHSATNREIHNRIGNLMEKYQHDTTLTSLLLKAQEYLTRQRRGYEESILPCLDYILILFENRYSLFPKKDVMKHGLLGIDSVETRLNQANERDYLQESQDPLTDLLKKLGSALRDNPASIRNLPGYDNDKIGLIENLLGIPDLDYLYFDGECDNSAPLRKKAYEIALEAFKNLPDEPTLLSSLGFSLIQFGEYEKALECFKRQSKKSTEDGVVWNNIAWCLMRLGKYEEALNPCERALELLSNSADVHYVYSTISVGLGRWDEAMKVIKNAISNLKPSELELLELYYLLPFVLERKGDINSAIIHWKQYLKLAVGKAGNEKAVLRVQDKLQEKGVKFSDTSNKKRYPIRKISEDVFNEIMTTIQPVIDIARKIGIKPLEFLTLEEVEKKRTALEPRCERIFEEAFALLKSLPSLELGIEREDGIKKRLTTNELYTKLKGEHHSEGTPFYMLVRNISPIIDDLPAFAFPWEKRRSIPNLKSEINTIKSEIEPIIKTAEFMIQIRQTGTTLEIETIKWLISMKQNSFKTKEKVESNMLNVPAILSEFERLFTKEVTGKYINHEFDYSVLWIEKLSSKLSERNQLLQQEYRSKQKNRDKLKDELSRKKNEGNMIEKKLKQKIEGLEEASRDNPKLLDLLQKGEEAIMPIMKLKKTGGIIAKLSGRRKKIEKAILQLETIRSQINKLRPGIIESVF